MDETTELRRYLYDLQGYLVIENVLSPELVAELNALIDAKVDPVPDNWEELGKESMLALYNVYRFGMAGGSYPSGPGFLDWGQPFVDLMDNPVVLDVMRAQLGDCFRLDRVFGMRMRRGMPNAPLHADYGASAHFARARPGESYVQPAHQALHGFAVAAFNLTDSGPDTGGLRVIPGSHNCRYKLPRPIRDEQLSGVAVCPSAPAGSVVIFTEATTHGTAAWTAEHERRTLIYKYCVSELSWSRTRVTAPEKAELTERQKLLLESPAGSHFFFPSLFEEDQQELAAD